MVYTLINHTFLTNHSERRVLSRKFNNARPGFQNACNYKRRKIENLCNILLQVLFFLFLSPVDQPISTITKFAVLASHDLSEQRLKLGDAVVNSATEVSQQGHSSLHASILRWLPT